MKSKRQEQTGVPPLKKDNTTFSTDKDKANVLNKTFYSVFTQEVFHSIPNINVSPITSIAPINVNINNEGISKLLNNLNSNKASGPDQLPIRLLKLASEELTPVLREIFQQSLNTGELPSDWRHALVTPVHKKDDRHNPSNHRPISLTCVLCKVLEHIGSHIMTHLEKHDLLSHFQHGFIHRNSTETQIVFKQYKTCHHQ